MIQLENASKPVKVAAWTTMAALLAFIFVITWVMVACAGLEILSGDLKVIDSARWLLHYRENARVALWNNIGLGTASVIVGVLLIMLLQKKKNLHGDARWANEAEIAREGLRSVTGIVLGRAAKKYLIYSGPEHVMVYAPTRAGKGVSEVIPNLLNYAASAVVLDMKKENWNISAGFRKAHGQRVIQFDPLDPEGRTARYNPLSYINREDPVECVDELQKIATMLFPHPVQGEPFWADAARVGFIGVGGLIAETPSLPFTFGQIYRELTQGAPKERLAKILFEREQSSRPLSEATRTSLADFVNSPDNTFGGVRQTITSRMSLWVNPRVDAATSVSDFDLRDVRSKLMTIYLGATPDNMDRVAPLYNLFFQQIIDLNTREMPTPKTASAPAKHPHRVLFILDEFARLGKAKVIADGFSYVAGYGLQLMPIIQDPSQLRAIYGPDGAKEIMANCGIEVIFTPKEHDVAKELSERIGFFDFKARSKSKPTHLGGGKHTTSESAQKRALMLPQELTQMNRNWLIILRGGIPAIKATRIFYYKDRDFKSRLMPAPEIPVMAGLPTSQAASQPSIADLMDTVASMAGQIEEIRNVIVVERRMTTEEAAGDAPLDMGMAMMTLEDLDIELPPLDAPEMAFTDFITNFVDKASTPALDNA